MYRVAKKHKARRVVGEFLNELVDAVVYDAFFFLADLFRGFIDEDYGGRKSAVSWAVVRGKGEAGRDNRENVGQETYIQMTAAGSLAREVPRRNLRR